MFKLNFLRNWGLRFFHQASNRNFQTCARVFDWEVISQNSSSKNTVVQNIRKIPLLSISSVFASSCFSETARSILSISFSIDHLKVVVKIFEKGTWLCPLDKNSDSLIIPETAFFIDCSQNSTSSLSNFWIDNFFLFFNPNQDSTSLYKIVGLGKSTFQILSPKCWLPSDRIIER